VPLRPDLEGQAKEFVGHLNDLLNRTVTNGVRLTAVMQDDGDIGWIGYGISSRAPFEHRAIPLSPDGTKPRCFLRVMETLGMDDEGDHLLVAQSTVSVSHDDSFADFLVRYDFVREPDNDYPAAHIQVGGTSPSALALCGQVGRVKDDLPRLHFPVGGKRFRPTVEDVIEFLIVERLISFHPDWREAVGEHRARWHDIQLQAAVRRRPRTAAAALRRAGWNVADPAIS